MLSYTVPLPNLTIAQKKKFNNAVQSSREHRYRHCIEARLKNLIAPSIYEKYVEYLKKYPEVGRKIVLHVFGGGKIPKCANPGCTNTPNFGRTEFRKYCSNSCVMVMAAHERDNAYKGPFQSDPGVRASISMGIQEWHLKCGTKPKSRRKHYADSITNTYTNESKGFYVYALLDPRKPGLFQYGRWKFDHEPFYIGKGKGNRANSHFILKLDEHGGNLHKRRKILKIIRETSEPPIICFKRTNLGEKDAHELETKLIALIGRKDMREGILTNLTDGGEGTSNRRCTPAQRAAMSTSTKLAQSRMRDQGVKLGAQKRTLAEFRSWINVKSNGTIEHIGSKYYGCREETKFRCLTCGHMWKVKPAQRIRCIKCWQFEQAEASKERRSLGAKLGHSKLSEKERLAKNARIGRSQKEVWNTGVHGSLHFTAKRKKEISSKMSISAKLAKQRKKL